MEPVVLDASVLYSAALRDLLVRLAIAGLVDARWTEAILDEAFAAVERRRPDLPPGALARTRGLMCQALPAAMAEGDDERAAGLQLPDPDDRHVVAAALHSGATLVATFNLRDFPDEVLVPIGLRAIHPDDLIAELYERNPVGVLRVLAQQADALRSPPVSLLALVEKLGDCGLVRSMVRIRGSFGGR